jgi:DNA polymerase I
VVYTVDFPADGTAVAWSLTGDGVERRERAYHPTLYAWATDRGSLGDVVDRLAGHPAVVAARRVERRPSWRHDARPVLAVDLLGLDDVERVAGRVARTGRPGTYRLFNVDLAREFRFCLETGTDPTPAREPTVLGLSAPPATFAEGGRLDELAVDPPGDAAGRTTTGDAGGRTVTGDPAEVAADAAALVDAHDPDVLRLSTARLVPRLFDAAAADREAYALGREPGYEQLAAASSYDSYGRVGHSPARYAVPGRALVDESNSFLLEKANLAGLLDVVERSGKPLQEAAWASIGNVLTSMQVRHAAERDVLVPWRAWRPELFKSAATLHAADRGGFTFAPDVGVHGDVHELDFASLYPSIMVTRNVSPETVRCDCHPDREDVPGLDYAICPEPGYLPAVLEPLVADRQAIKDRLESVEEPDERAALQGEADALKWILVACFGYQGFDNAKFGRVEAHEAINAFAREILLDAKDALEAAGWRVLHGIVDSIWVTPMADREQTPLETVAVEVSERAGIPLEYETAYDWVAFCPRRDDDAGALTRYFGKVADEPTGDPDSYRRRGIEARQRSTPDYVADVQLDLVATFDRTRDPAAVCDRLAGHLRDLRQGDVDAGRLAIRNRVSKPADAYAHRTRTVAALERAGDAGFDRHPGQDVRYVVVDDDRTGRDRVALASEAPATYDAAFYADELHRAAASVLSPLGWREGDVREYLDDRETATLDSFGT